MVARRPRGYSEANGQLESKVVTHDFSAVGFLGFALDTHGARHGESKCILVLRGIMFS